MLGEERTAIKAWAAASVLDGVPLVCRDIRAPGMTGSLGETVPELGRSRGTSCLGGCQDMPHPHVPRAFSTDTQQWLTLQSSFQQYFSAVSWEDQGNGHILALNAARRLQEQQVLHYPDHCNKVFNFWLMLCGSFSPCSLPTQPQLVLYVQWHKVTLVDLLTLRFSLSFLGSAFL